MTSKIIVNIVGELANQRRLGGAKTAALSPLQNGSLKASASQHGRHRSPVAGPDRSASQHGRRLPVRPYGGPNENCI